MTISWPSGGTFPQLIQQDGYKETTPNELLRTQMDAGPAKVRRRFTAGVRTFSAQLYMNLTDIQTFDDFFNNSIGAGALQFQWVHPRTGAAILARITNQPVYSASGPWFAVAFDFEVLP